MIQWCMQYPIPATLLAALAIITAGVCVHSTCIAIVAFCRRPVVHNHYTNNEKQQLLRR